MAFTIPNEAGVGFLAQAEPDKVDIDILVAGYARTGVVSGCAVTAQGTPDMTVAVASGTIAVAATQQAVTAGNVTITAADATNPRIDLVVVSNTGTKSVQAGTPAADPVMPAIPANSVVLAAVYVPANDTAIDANQIIDKRVLIYDLETALAGYQALSVYDAAGDLLYGTAADTSGRLAIGTAGKVLRVNSGATAPEWAAGLTLIAESVLGADAASVDFQSIPATYRHLLILANPHISSAADPVFAWMRFNNESDAGRYVHTRLQVQSSATATSVTSDTKCVLGEIGSTTWGRESILEVLIPGYAVSGVNKHYRSRTSTSDGSPTIDDGGGFTANTGAIDRVTLLPSTGSFASGCVFSLYGLG